MSSSRVNMENWKIFFDLGSVVEEFSLKFTGASLRVVFHTP